MIVAVFDASTLRSFGINIIRMLTNKCVARVRISIYDTYKIYTTIFYFFSIHFNSGFSLRLSLVARARIRRSRSKHIKRVNELGRGELRRIQEPNFFVVFENS